jgi:hypothetical protein
MLVVAAIGLCSITPTAAQSPSDAASSVAAVEPSATLDLYVDAPPPPTAPDVIRRDSEGRATVRAVRVAQPLRIDGALDEALYREVPSMSEFIQVEPDGGQPATERTETWIAFDDDNVYVSFKVWDTQMENVLRPAELVHVHHEPARRPVGRDDGERPAVQQRLESGLGNEAWPL